MLHKILKLSTFIFILLFTFNLQAQEFKFKKKINKFVFKTIEGDYDYNLVFDAIGNKQNGIVPVKEGEKWGLLDELGGFITAVKYDEIEPHFKVGYIVKLDEKYGFLDEEGTIVLPIEYDEIDSFEETKGIVKKDGVWGIVENNEFRTRGK